MMKKPRSAIRIAVMMVLVLLMAVIIAPGMTDGKAAATPPRGTVKPGKTNIPTAKPTDGSYGATTPGSTTPGATTPGATMPGTTKPGATTPGSTTPGATKPGTTKPGMTTPGATKPGTTKPGATTPDSTPRPETTKQTTPKPKTPAPGPETTKPTTSTPKAVMTTKPTMPETEPTPEYVPMISDIGPESKSSTPEPASEYVLIPRITEINTDPKYIFQDQGDDLATFHVSGDPGVMITVEIIPIAGNIVTINTNGPTDTNDTTNGKIDVKYSQLFSAEKIIVYYFDLGRDSNCKTTYAVYRDQLPPDPEEPYLLFMKPEYTVKADGAVINPGDEIDEDLKELSVEAPEYLDIVLWINDAENTVPQRPDLSGPGRYVFGLEGRLKGNDEIYLELKDSFGNPIKVPLHFRVAPASAPALFPVWIDGMGSKYAFLDQRDNLAWFSVYGQPGEQIELTCVTEGGTPITRPVIYDAVFFTYGELSESKQITAYYQGHPEYQWTYAIYHSMEEIPLYTEGKPYLLLLSAKFKVLADGEEIAADGTGIDERSLMLSVRTPADLNIVLQIADGEGNTADTRIIRPNTDAELNGNDRGLHAGDTLTLKLTDDFGNSKELRYPVKAALREKIEVTPALESPGALMENGKIYVDNDQVPKITLAVKAGKFRTILLTVEPYLRLEGRTDEEGKCDLTIPLTGWEEGNYGITVSCPDANGNDGTQWKTEIIVDYSVQSVVPVGDVREGATKISVRCEPYARLSLIVNGELRYETTADENGFAELEAGQPVRRDDRIVIKTADILNHRGTNTVIVQPGP